MSGTHGDLFSEIGKLVLAAHAGQAIDLEKKSTEMAHRYWKLGVPAESIARAIARSLGAVSMSMAIVRPPERGVLVAQGKPAAAAIDAAGSATSTADAPEPAEAAEKPLTALFPSGVRLAVLS